MKKYRAMFFHTFTTLAICSVATALYAQTGQLSVTKGLTVTVLQGDGVQNELPRAAATRLSIRVLDGQSNPISNAVAAFELPEDGASAAFIDGSNVKVFLTDQNGEATAEIRPNALPGKFQPRVTVNYLGQTSSVSLNQENLFPASANPSIRNQLLRGSHRSHTKWLIIAGVAAATVAAILARHHGHSSASTPPSGGGITITPGSGSVQGGN
jgi:hypothetical protein